MDLSLPIVLAQAAPAAGGGAAASPGGGLSDMLIMLAIIGVAFYFLILRPQSADRKKREEALSKMSKGDKVITAGGIHGVIAEVGDNKDTLGIEIAKGVRITVNRSSISVVNPKASEKPAEAPAADSSKGVVGKKAAKA